MGRPLSELEAHCQGIGKTIAGALPGGVGFCLMVFDFGEGGHMTYLSNAEREDMKKAIAEFQSALDNGIVQPPGHPEPGIS